MPADETTPQPGPDRDLEIALALGWQWVDLPDPIDGGRIHRMLMPDGEIAAELPQWSTDGTACHRLIDDLIQRRWCVTTFSTPDGHRAAVSHYPGCRHRHPLVRGSNLADAVSAAALSALRGDDRVDREGSP